jgi:hypothetical protein
LLLPVRFDLWQIDGSHAQRDDVDWTLTEAAVRAGQRDVALSLAHERLATRPRSTTHSIIARSGGLVVGHRERRSVAAPARAGRAGFTPENNHAIAIVALYSRGDIGTRERVPSWL